ncbi:Ribbon-helix-helix protein, copG family [Fulvimarina manganoxydans]|uniref:Ribbon-helix-helix protein, copG family n=1 Tax=Fulvimarina manganoxydans TaxID=937218 RepID=A0A1W2AHE1_9HYPH|nr:ribbon-helix-helix protein, CopG family [Fulvimarina manganoxydans]MEE2949889.1 ribbon-helix-helix protein, CopG family [Pseudomonadota bacterium]SMC60139.1 Ribbon-helix-helix protein, copG family [Fulvimarina manganoxydans]
MPRTLTVTLPDEMADRVMQRVETGEFASLDALMREAIASLDGPLEDADSEDLRERMRIAKDDPRPRVELSTATEQVRAELRKEFGRL